MSNFKSNFERMMNEDDFNPERYTGVLCDYVDHKSRRTAIINVQIANDCCHKDEFRFINLCWACSITAYHGNFRCACGDPEESGKSPDEITFLGELAEVAEPAKR